MGLFTLCKKFDPKIVNLNFDDVIANHEYVSYFVPLKTYNPGKGILTSPERE